LGPETKEENSKEGSKEKSYHVWAAQVRVTGGIKVKSPGEKVA
jgi:hypothetical protein